MNNQVKIPICRLVEVTLYYMFIPILIMILGWTSLAFSIPISAVFVVALIITRKKTTSDRAFSIQKKYLIIIIIIAVAIGILAGWGGFVPQSTDWDKHNALFRDLITRDWPVIYNNNGVESMLTYYMGQYMVPAALGKIVLLISPTSFEMAFVIGEIVMLIWNVIGLVLVMFFVVNLTENRPVLSSICFVVFGSLLPLGRLLISVFYDNSISVIAGGFQHNMDLNLIGAQYTTNFVQLRWVFPQCIVPWLVMAILLSGILKIDSYAVIGFPVLLFSSFPFIGIIPYMIIDVIRSVEKEAIKGTIKKIFSLQNILILISVGSFAALYYWGYVFASDKPDILKFKINYFTVPSYILFVLVSVGIYMLLLIPALRRTVKFDKAYFAVSAAILVVLPLYRMGGSNDFTMRVSIPALFIVCIAYLRTMFNKEIQKRKIYWSILLIAFIIGTIYPIMEMETVLAENDFTNHQELTDQFGSLEYYANPDLKNTDPLRFYLNNGFTDILYNYYTYENDMRFFMETIGKK